MVPSSFHFRKGSPGSKLQTQYTATLANLIANASSLHHIWEFRWLNGLKARSTVMSPLRPPSLPGPDFRLVPHSAVADGNGARLSQTPSRFPHEEGPDEHHGPVGQFVAHGFHVCAIRLHLEKEHKIELLLLNLRGSFGQWFSKCGPQYSSIGVARELV